MLELETQPFNVRDCIESVLDLIAPQAAHKSIELAYVLDDATPPVVVGDVTRLRQVLVNLTGNAVKFTELGEVVVSVADRLLDGQRHELQVTVKDTGIGVPPEQLQRLFQPFSQGDASVTRKYGGTGLGLTISQRLVELMGGRMWIDSEVGRGTSVHFTFVTEAASGATPCAELRAEQPALRGRRLLIVDDNATNRRLVERQVEAWGMSARGTGSPLEALEWIRQREPFDLAIVDMHMPELDGLELCAEIRKLRGAALPLVLFSSLGRRESHTETVAPDAYVSKPLKPAHLLDALLRVSAGQPAHAPAAPAARLPNGTAPLGTRHPMRLLVVEDNPVNQKLAVRMLQRLGYRADLAGNGREALEALDRQHYDVVLMDVHMPELDGLAATRQIRARGATADQPYIIAMTADAMEGDREVCLAAGMNDYLSKPIRADDLAAALSGLVGRGV
jgi:CheY-like chemotaxis protein